MILLCCVCIIKSGWKRWIGLMIGQPFLSNQRYIKGGVKQPSDMSRSIFIPGIFQYYYFQYEKAHGPFSMRLGFYPQADYTVHGGGKDDIGTYVITGVYSPETLRMGLIKQYQAGTGNSSENLGHQVTIQVEWNFELQQFDGRYYLRTKLHSDQNSVVIRREHSNNFHSLNI